VGVKRGWYDGVHGLTDTDKGQGIGSGSGSNDLTDAHGEEVEFKVKVDEVEVEVVVVDRIGCSMCWLVGCYILRVVVALLRTIR
jgi:hypothetical protein